jgi:hypothetical protein
VGALEMSYPLAKESVLSGAALAGFTSFFARISCCLGSGAPSSSRWSSSSCGPAALSRLAGVAVFLAGLAGVLADRQARGEGQARGGAQQVDKAGVLVAGERSYGAAGRHDTDSMVVVVRHDH